MSYFPCDIPYMSKEELEENGIRIPKDKTEKKQEQPKIIRCGECAKHKKLSCPFGIWSEAPVDGYCHLAERRTDG